VQDYSGYRKWYVWEGNPDAEDNDYVPAETVTFGYFQSTEDKATMFMAWYLDTPTTNLTLQLEVHSDGWAALAQSTHLLYKLGETTGRDIQPGEFCALLEECGFEEGDPEAGEQAEAE